MPLATGFKLSENFKVKFWIFLLLITIYFILFNTLSNLLVRMNFEAIFFIMFFAIGSYIGRNDFRLEDISVSGYPKIALLWLLVNDYVCAVIFSWGQQSLWVYIERLIFEPFGLLLYSITWGFGLGFYITRRWFRRRMTRRGLFDDNANASPETYPTPKPSKLFDVLDQVEKEHHTIHNTGNSGT